MKRAVSGSGVIIVRMVAAVVITLDDQGTQLLLSLKGVPGSWRNDKPCLALSSLDSVGVLTKFLLLSTIFPL